jgi:hypothetical protein
VSIVVAGVCAAIGIVALPLLFAQPQLAAAPWSTAVWLALAVLISVCLLVVALPGLSRPLAIWLGSRVASKAVGPTVTPSQILLVAQLVVLGVLLVIVQAILRRPLALLLGGGERGSGSYEAAIAATVLALILALLVWLYQSARPLMQSVTLRAIDAAIPTVAPAPDHEPTRTVTPVVSTLPATAADEPTLRAPSSAEDRTLPAQPASEADTPTLITGGRDRVDPDATVRVNDPDATLHAEGPV